MFCEELFQISARILLINCARIDESIRSARSLLEEGPFHISSTPPQTAAGGNKTEGSNTIMSTSIALKFGPIKLMMST